MKKTETRNMIIQTSRKLFMELGYRAVSTRQIADTCGITQPALYHHFSGKTELYVEVIRSVSLETKQSMDEILAQDLSTEKCLLKVVSYMIRHHPNDLTQMFHDIQHELPEPSQKQIQVWWHEAYLYPMIEVFKKGFTDGSLRDPQESGYTPTVCARLLMTLINHALSSTIFTIGKETKASDRSEEAAKKIISFFLYGFASDSIH